MTTWAEDLDDSLDDIYIDAGISGTYNGVDVTFLDVGADDTTSGDPGIFLATRTLQVRESEVSICNEGDLVTVGSTNYSVSPTPTLSGGNWTIFLNTALVTL